MKRNRGFTLIELMIVVVVITVLAMIAFPMYTKQLQKSRRAEAKQTLADYSLREEKWRANHTTYTSTMADIGGSATSLPNGYYTIAISFPTTGNCPGTGGAAKGSANSFIITATAAGVQAADSSCATIVLTNDCGTVSKSSSPAGSATCW